MASEETKKQRLKEKLQEIQDLINEIKAILKGEEQPK